MRLSSTIRRTTQLIALAAIVFLSSCAATTKKYGCPNHLHVFSFMR